MAEGKIDLPEDLVLSKPVVEAWTAKDDSSGGNDEEKLLMGFLDVSKDQVTSESSIPLSPQWLYAKPSESKAGPGLSTASVDARPPSSLPQGTSSDSIQKDSWRLDGSQDKKEWRRNVPDVDSSRRWREEERETGLLGRRDRRKEGDRENEYRKSDRRSDNVSMRETTDSRALSLSERWHDVTSRNSGHENRRDSKWSSRWGPEDKEKDSRAEKKTDADKEDVHTEKQSFGVSNRPTSESDSRDKWRPRHRQEAHSVGSTVYRAAPGFGLERGRVEGSNFGFAPGRGRSNSTASLPHSRFSSTPPIGAVPISKSESMHGKSGLSGDTFRYPRGKLLDVYRKHTVPSSFDTALGGLEEVPLITQSSSIAPLAFVTPDAEEEALLQDIWNGTVTSSEVYHNSSGDKMGRVKDSEPVVGDLNSSEKNHGILSTSYSEGCSFTNSAEQDSILGVCKSKVNNLIDGADPGAGAPTVIKDDACYNIRVPDSGYTDSEQKVGGKKVVNVDRNVGHSVFFSNPNFEGIESAAPFDIRAKLPDDSNSLFDTPFVQETSSTNEQYQNSNGEVNLFEQGPPEELSLFYRDPQGEIQGPFLGVDIISWFDQGFFSTDLPVCLSDAPEGTPFQQLGEVMPHLELKARSIPESSDTTSGNLESSTLAADFSGSSINDQRWAPSEFEGPLEPQAQTRLPESECLMDSHYGGLQLSSLETSDANLSADRQTFHEFSGQDAEEVLYSGRPYNSIGSAATYLHDMPRTPSGNHFLAGEMGETNFTNPKVPTDKDLHPFGLLWSELDGTHPKRPLSSSISRIGDRGHIINPVMEDSSLFTHDQESFTSLDDSAIIRDVRPNSYRRNTSSNILQDAMGAHHFSHLEPESNHFSLEEHLLSQQLQKQQLQQQYLLSQQNMHLTDSFLEQLQGGVHPQQSVNQSVPDLDNLLKLQFQQKQRFQQLRQQHQLEQQQQQQQQLHHHQMQLLQQQQQQQQQHHHHQQQQLLFEQLLRQQSHDPGFGTSRIDHLRGNDMIDQVLFRQQLLHELQQQSHHLPRHHDPSLEQLIQAKFGHNLHLEHHNDLLDVLSHPKHRQMLPLEQQLLLGLQQEQMQARQFSMTSRRHPGMEEERRVGGVWSIDESGQFIREAAGPHQTESGGLSQVDFLQLQHRPSSFEQPGHHEGNLTLHELMQRGLYEPSSQPFERSVPLSAGTSGSNVDFVNALARFQGLDVQEQLGQMHSSGQVGQVPSGIHSHANQIPRQIRASHLDSIESRWPESNRQPPNSLIESRFNQLHMEVEQEKRDIQVNASIKDPTAWPSFAGNDDNSKHGFVDLLHQNQGMIDGAPASSYGMRESSWLFSTPVSNRLAEKAGAGDAFGEGCVPKVGQVSHERFTNVEMKQQANIIESSGKLAFQSNTGPLIGDKQFCTDLDEISKKLFADSVVGNPSMDRFDFSDLEGKRANMRGSKGKVMTALDTPEIGVEQAGGSFVDLGDLKVNAPIRHASFGSNGGSMSSYNYGMGVDNAYREEMVNDRISGFVSKGVDNSLLKQPHGSHVISSQGGLAELASTPSIRGKTPINFASSEEGAREPGVNQATPVLETSASGKKEMKFRRTSSSCSDADAPEASFIDMLKSTKKPAPEADASYGALEYSDACPGGKSSKKKGKKGRQIDPSLLGFKVHSNRIMMGEIHRLDD